MKVKKNTRKSVIAKETTINFINELRRYLLEKRKPTVLSKEDKKVIINHLSKLQVQVDAIKAMVECDDDYNNVIKQIENSRRVLNSAETLLLESHSALFY